MTSLRGSWRPIAVGVLAVAVSVAGNQILNGGKWNLWWLLGAIVLAVLAEGLNMWLGSHESDHYLGGGPARPELWPNLKGDDGVPLLLREVTPVDLGVRPSRFGRDGGSPYIHRDTDDLLMAALDDDAKKVIIVEGPRLAGATSTLAQAAQACLPDHLAAGFVDDPRVPLTDMITQAGRWATTQAKASGAVLWLDGLTPDRFIELARAPLEDLPPGIRVLATLDISELEGLRVPEQLNLLLDDHAVRAQLGTINEEERRDLLAQDIYAPLRPVLEEADDLFMGRLMVAWEPIRAALTRGGSEQATDRVALLHAITDWYRVRLPRLLSPDVLSDLFQEYRRELKDVAPDSAVSATGFNNALQWATAPPTADRPGLIDLQNVPGGQQYTPHPLLTVIADDPSEETSWPVSNVLWVYSDTYFQGDSRRDVGYSALARGAVHAAARLLSHTDTKIDSAAYNQVAELFYELGEWANSHKWWQKTIATGHTDYAPAAMYGLGAVEDQQGNSNQARHWWQQAIATGHTYYAPAAMNSLGSLEYKQGNLAQARHLWQQAIATGHTYYAPAAMNSLGSLEYKQGNLAQARHWPVSGDNRDRGHYRRRGSYRTRRSSSDTARRGDTTRRAAKKSAGYE